MGKNRVKGATQVNGHFFKLHFCMLERSQVKHNSLDCHDFFGIFIINCKSLHVQSLTQIKFFCMFKALKPWKWTILVFVKCLFLLPNVHHSWKLERILTLMMKRTKGLELIFIINLNTFGSKVFLILKIMDFENLPSTKVVHVYAIEGIYMI